MFDLSACQNRIKFAEFFNEWLKKELAEMRAENHKLFTALDYNAEDLDRLERLTDFGFQLVNRKIIKNCVRTTFAVPYDDGEVEERYYFNFYTDNTKRGICFAVLENCDLYGRGLRFSMTDKFITEMKKLPGYCKSFDEIEED